MRRLAPALVLAIAVSGCAATPHRAPDLRLPGRYESPTAAVLTPAQLDRWWLQFGDAALDALEDEAFLHSPDARTQAARVMEARATRNGQTAQTLPSGSLGGNAKRQTAYNIGPASTQLFPVGGTTESLSGNFNVSWEIDLFGRLAVARKVANANMAQARFNIEGSRASLAAAVADNYFQAKGLVGQLLDARESVRIQTSLQDVAQRRAGLGLGSPTDADRVAGDLAQSRAQYENLQAQLHAAERQLLILVGRGFDPTVSLKMGPQLGDPPPVPTAVPGDLLARRPDVREAEARMASEAGTARLRHLAVFPTFTLLPGLGLSRTTSPGVSFIPPATIRPQQQTTSLGFWSLAVGVNAPTLDIPKLLYEAKAEDARAEQAVIAYEKIVQTAYGEADNTLVNLSAGERALAGLVDGEARAKRASDAAQKRYAMGLDDLTAALSAQQAWLSTHGALTASRVQTLRQAVSAYKALGGGWAYSTTTKPQRTGKAP